MARRYVITSPANQDVEDILREISDRSSFDRADRFLKQLNEKLRKIVNFPNLGKPRPEWGESYRTLILDNYLIVYRVTDDLVEVLRVVSGYRDLDSLFDGN
jgi:toxin ParE1/3/4